MKSIKEANVKGKKVFLRADLDVPIKNGKVADDSRLKAALPTIQYLLKKNAKIIICGHLGRPEGKPDKKSSLKPAAERLSKLLNKKIKFVPDCIGLKVKKEASALKEKEILLLENVRFYPEEEKDSETFAKKLAENADVFVHDAFASHRNHSSTHAIAKYLPSYAGLLVEKELGILQKLLQKPKKPFIIILGGAKTGTKIDILSNLPKSTDKVLIGGAMAFTFLKAKGYETGKSLYEPDKIKTAKMLINKLKEKLILPSDFIIQNGKNVNENKFKPEMNGLDIGKETVKEYSAIIKKAKTVFWNGPMGLFEGKKYSGGTKKTALAIAKCKGTTILAGGDTEHAIHMFKLSKKYTHVSTGGGAALNILAGKKISAIEALK